MPGEEYKSWPARHLALTDALPGHSPGSDHEAAETLLCRNEIEGAPEDTSDLGASRRKCRVS